MKLRHQNNFKYVLAVLALTGAVWLNPGAKAVPTYSYINNDPSYTEGDLFLTVGDQADGVTNSYIADVGNISALTSLAPGATLNLGNFGFDLNAVFGPSSNSSTTWQSSGAIWQVAGEVADSGGSVDGFNYQSIFITSTGGAASLTAIKANSQFKNTGNDLVSGLGFQYQFYTTGTPAATSSQAVVAVGMDILGTPSVSGGHLGGTNQSAVTVLSGNTLDLLAFQTNANGNGSTTDVTDLGFFTLASNGDLLFTAASAVPEPSTWAMMLGGLAAMLLVSRRRSRLN